MPEQPIFYPVLAVDYARMIARDWNTIDERSGYVGFVTRFDVDNQFVSRYPVQRAGGQTIEELWVPAEELSEFNAHIVGPIEVVEAYTGSSFRGRLDGNSLLPIEQ